MAAGDLCLPRSRRIPSSRPRVPRPRKTELSGRYLAARVAYALVIGARYPAPRISRGDVMLRYMFPGAALRSEDRRVGKEWVSTWRSRWSRCHEKKKENK